MVIKELLEGTSYSVLQGSDVEEVESIVWDSRKVKHKSLFICVKGRNVDRHDYALQAIASGATALVIEHEIQELPNSVTVIRVDNSRAAMASIASIYYGEPSRHCNLIGITGTNGKTSVSWFIAKILEEAGRKTGVIGTIENRIGSEKMKVEKMNPTTPDSIELQGALAEMREEGVTDVAMEVTSTALVNHRVDHCHFDIGVFTNLTQDHLDEHGTMENYKNAKLRLFNICRQGIVNADDAIYPDIKKTATCETLLTYGIDKDADIKAVDIHYGIDAVSFILCFQGTREKVTLRVPGKFSVYNILAAIGACYLSGLSLDRIIAGVEKIEGVKGRFEAISNPKGCLVIVDYAHTPDGLDNILSTAKALAKKRLITVFGCGGDRDRTKRPIMGKLAGKWSDFCIITSDNPRTEDPQLIMKDIEEGMKETSCHYEKIENRGTAIHRALDFAQAEDIIIIAGKGHENYQIFANHTIHFDDGEIVNEYFKNKTDCC